MKEYLIELKNWCFDVIILLIGLSIIVYGTYEFCARWNIQ